MAKNMASKETDYYAEAFKRVNETPAGSPRPEAEKPNWFKRFIEKVAKAAKEKEAREAKILFARANSGNVRERRQFRFDIGKTKQPNVTLEQAKKDLSIAWKAAGLSVGDTSQKIANPDAIKNSAVAAEMVTRITALPLELRKNPEIVYRKVAEAYSRIDWSSLTREQEVELRTTIENSFNYIREQDKAQDLKVVPENNEQLWRGLNDFYLSASIPEEIALPSEDQPGYKEAVSQNVKRNKLRSRLLEIQRTLSLEPSDANVKKYLNDAWRDLNDGYVVEVTAGKRTVRQRRSYIREDVEPIMAKLRDEANQWEGRGGSGGRAAVEEEIPATVMYEDLKESIAKRTGGKGILDDLIVAEKLDTLFPKEEHASLKARLLSVRKWMGLDGPDGIGANGAYSLESAKQTLRNISTDRNLVLNEAQTEFIQKCSSRVESETMRIRQENQPMSRFYLTTAERKGLDAAPIATIDHMFDSLIDQIIRDPEGPRARAAMERLQLMQEYLFSDEFDRSRMPQAYEMTPEGMLQKLSDLELEKTRNNFRQRSAKQRESFGRSFTIRLHAAQFFEAWSNADSPANQEFQRFLNSRMNEDDFFGLDGLYGNLVTRAREKLRINYEALLFDSHSIKQGYDTDLLDKAVKQTLEEMKANKNFEKIYNDDYLSGRLFKERPRDDKEKIELGPRSAGEAGAEPTELEAMQRRNRYEDACSTIVSLANIRMIMSQEKTNLDIRFRPIKWAVAAGKAPSTFLEKAKLAKLMRPYETHMMTWGSFAARPAFEKAQLRHRAGIIKEALPHENFKNWVDEWTDGVWEGLGRFKNGAMKEEHEINAMLADMEVIYFFTPDPAEAPTAGDLRLIRRDENELTGKEKAKREKWKNWVDKLSKDKLRKEVEIYAALQDDQQHTMRPYSMMFESGYRRDSETNFLKEFEQSIEGALGSEGSEGVFVASKVVGAADSYFMKIYTRESDSEALLKATAEASRYRPHSMALVLKEGGSKALDAWSYKSIGGKDNFIAMYKEHALCFEEIRADLLNRRHKQIKYDEGFAGLSEIQRQAALEVFRLRHPEPPGNAEEATKKYFDTMQDLSKTLAGEYDSATKKWTNHGLVKEFTSIRYSQYLSKARWDDYPYELLQYPERAVSGTDTEIPIRVSDKFKGGRAGEEQSGPWRRMWRDGGGAQTVFEQLGPMFDPDPKIRLKAIQTAYITENGYQGPTHAAINYLMSSGGRLGAEKLRPKTGLIRTGPFLAGRPGNSDAWEYYDGEFQGRTVEELKHELEEDMRVSSGKIINAGPDAEGIFEAVESYLGISSWGKIIMGGYDNNSPIAGLIKTVARARSVDVEHALHKAHKAIGYFSERWPSGILRQKFVIIAAWAGLAVLVASLAQVQQKDEAKGRH